MSKRAYIASVEIRIPVVAESPEVARELAAKQFRDETCDASDFDLDPMHDIPCPYEPDDYVCYDGPGEMTAAEAIKLPGGYEHDCPNRLSELVTAFKESKLREEEAVEQVKLTSVDEIRAQYPVLTSCLLEIIYDNNGIYRDRTEEQALDELLPGLFAKFGSSLDVVDQWLGTLSQTMRETLCVGEYSDARVVLECFPEKLRQTIDDVLNYPIDGFVVDQSKEPT